MRACLILLIATLIFPVLGLGNYQEQVQEIRPCGKLSDEQRAAFQQRVASEEREKCKKALKESIECCANPESCDVFQPQEPVNVEGEPPAESSLRAARTTTLTANYHEQARLQCEEAKKWVNRDCEVPIEDGGTTASWSPGYMSRDNLNQFFDENIRCQNNQAEINRMAAQQQIESYNSMTGQKRSLLCPRGNTMCMVSNPGGFVEAREKTGRLGGGVWIKGNDINGELSGTVNENGEVETAIHSFGKQPAGKSWENPREDDYSYATAKEGQVVDMSYYDKNGNFIETKGRVSSVHPETDRVVIKPLNSTGSIQNIRRVESVRDVFLDETVPSGQAIEAADGSGLRVSREWLNNNMTSGSRIFHEGTVWNFDEGKKDPYVTTSSGFGGFDPTSGPQVEGGTPLERVGTVYSNSYSRPGMSGGATLFRSDRDSKIYRIGQNNLWDAKPNPYGGYFDESAYAYPRRYAVSDISEDKLLAGKNIMQNLAEY